jgi:hypothetical protein
MTELYSSACLALEKQRLHKDFEDLDKVQAKLRWITSAAFPISHWPDYLEPLPSVRTGLSCLWAMKSGSDQLEALRLMLRGMMLSRQYRRASCAEWVHEMADLTAVLVLLGKEPATSNLFEDEDFPTLAEIRVLACGFLSETDKSATRIYGLDTRYSISFREWKEHMLKHEPATADEASLKVSFRKAQAKLLLWAGVDKYAGIRMS